MPEARRVAAEAGKAGARYRLARQLQDAGELDAATVWLWRAADRGYAQARLTRTLDKHAGRPELADVRPFWEQLDIDGLV